MGWTRHLGNSDFSLSQPFCYVPRALGPRQLKTSVHLPVINFHSKLRHSSATLCPWAPCTQTHFSKPPSPLAIPTISRERKSWGLQERGRVVLHLSHPHGLPQPASLLPFLFLPHHRLLSIAQLNERQPRFPLKITTPRQLQQGTSPTETVPYAYHPLSCISLIPNKLMGQWHKVTKLQKPGCHPAVTRAGRTSKPFSRHYLSGSISFPPALLLSTPVKY